MPRGLGTKTIVNIGSAWRNVGNGWCNSKRAASGHSGPGARYQKNDLEEGETPRNRAASLLRCHHDWAACADSLLLMKCLRPDAGLLITGHRLDGKIIAAVSKDGPPKRVLRLFPHGNPLHGIDKLHLSDSTVSDRLALLRRPAGRRSDYSERASWARCCHAFGEQAWPELSIMTRLTPMREPGFIAQPSRARLAYQHHHPQTG